MAMRALSWWVCWCALWASAAVSAGELPAGARVLFAPEPGDGALRIGGAQVELGRVERVAIDHEAAGAAYRVETRDAARQRWNLQLRGDLPVELRPGEVLLLTGYARCVSSTTGDGMFRVKVEQNADPWREGVARGFAFGPDWRRFDFPFVVPGSEPFRVGQTQLTFHVGEARQTIELAGVRLYGFEAWASVDDLPRTRVTYAGREAGAAWRAVAAERIERHRKADLTVRVVDAQGRGVAGASVRVAQRDHAFAFGAAFNLRVFTGGGADVPRYERAFVERFNSVVFENELKWYGPGLRDLSAVEAGLSFAEAHGLTTRGHVLVWPGRRRVPAEVVAMIDRLRAEPGDATTRAALADAVAERVRTVAGQLAGRIDDWDVVNEPFSNHDILDVLNPPGTPIGSGVMAEWFRMAHEADPDARLYLNDYGILAATSLEDAHLRSHYDTARRLLEAGAPLHGLGMQGHFGSSLTPPERLWEVLDLFAELGLSIKATEFDVNLDDPAVIADYTRDFYTALFAHPSVDGILSWGFWAGAHWRPDAAYLDRGFNPRPSDVALRRLLFETWWTDESATTDGQGEARVRGFHGAYEVTVALPG
ncbi:MAG: endo-1,4-beta-xylanase, partial [Planctomycetota bacterium]